MEVKKLRGLKKICIKYLRPQLYRKYKRVMLKLTERPLIHEHIRRNPVMMWRQKSAGVKHPVLRPETGDVVTFMHSGNSGDIIYALPAMYKLAGTKKARLFLHLDRPGIYDTFHPLGNVMLNKKMADMLDPLLSSQSQIESVRPYNGEKIDFNLDEFRNYTFILDRGSIARWYFNVFAITAPLYKPWLITPKDSRVKDSIVIARSHRYRNPLIDYSFISKYPSLFFIGVEEEYRDMKEMLPTIQWLPVKDFLEMATLINGARLFIGNQSFPFSIAEGLKCNRLLEAFYRIPNVIPEGPGANDFYYQPQFELMVDELYTNPDLTV